jgi:hypothetical protein
VQGHVLADTLVRGERVLPLQHRQREACELGELPVACAQRGKWQVGKCALDEACESVVSTVSRHSRRPPTSGRTPFDIWSRHSTSDGANAACVAKGVGWVRVPGLVEQGRCWSSQAEAAFTQPVVEPGRATSLLVDCVAATRGAGATVRRRRADWAMRHMVIKVVVVVVLARRRSAEGAR